jgi:hypothetical protein
MLPNRLAVYLTVAVALVGGLLPAVADFDWESTVGIVAGLVVVLGVVREWLVNWGKWERGEGAGLLPGEFEDEFDEASAEPIPPAVAEAAHTPETSYLPGGQVPAGPPRPDAPPPPPAPRPR